ncbi:MAG: hypothetical protein U1F31_02385 [Steroidobacteraceae bacterium]|jgi:hypothetical protein
MKDVRRKTAKIAAVAGLMLAASTTEAVEVRDLVGHDALFGRYAPAGDCKREPRIIVDATGIAFHWSGKAVKPATFEYAASYGPHDYAGISVWIFPFILKDGYSILMTFNSNEVKGVLTVEPHDEGYAGGPPLTPLNAALVKGSPYRKCQQAR